MIFKDEYDNSNLTRWLFITVIFIVIFISGLLMFADDWLADSWMASYKINGDFTRQIILMICLTIYCLFMGLCRFIYLPIHQQAWNRTVYLVAQRPVMRP